MIIEVSLLVLIVILMLKFFQRDDQLPPGERGLPIVGVLPFMGSSKKNYVARMQEKFGNIFSLQLGSRTAVFLKDSEEIRDALSKQEFAGRPSIYTLSLFSSEQYGISFNSGPGWEANRRFALRHLRDFGFGKGNKMQSKIALEVQCLMDELISKTGEPIDIWKFFNIPVLNVIWGLVADVRFASDDPKMFKLAQSLNEDAMLISGPIEILDHFPILIPILPDFVKRWLKVDVLMRNRKETFTYFKEIITEHERSLDRSNPRDLIDSYLIEMEKNDDIKSHFKEPINNLSAMMADLFDAGLETTSTTLAWFSLFMAAHPEIQSKIQKELDSTFPRGEIPLLEHKDRLPYLQATISELMRFVPLLPYLLAHGLSQDVFFGGFKIPKDSMVFACVECCHYDAKIWEKPLEFYPEHFLDEEGRFRARTSSILSFGFGKRLCLGESLARMELFMFCGALVQKFKISPPIDTKLNLKPDERVFLMNYPTPFKVVLEKREE